MGKLGFLFNIENDTNQESIVIFTNNKKIKKDIIISDKHLKISQTKFYIMNKYNDLEEFLVFDNSLFKIAQIRTHPKSIVDFNDFIFWFNPTLYRKIRQLLLIINQNDELIIEEEIKLKIIELNKIFEKYLK